ncbi:hypothetical protein A0H81_03242 [Grifola frondosa]|uniref:Uncharacterized protein n=1 Tax=Grifola frondosa TaxID=5627 RepID=A0A1C7MJW2_GRIFR|nr:hypothetical protein A0H81_03242 [Grifola frondosa]
MRNAHGYNLDFNLFVGNVPNPSSPPLPLLSPHPPISQVEVVYHKILTCGHHRPGGSCIACPPHTEILSTV